MAPCVEPFQMLLSEGQTAFSVCMQQRIMRHDERKVPRCKRVWLPDQADIQLGNFFEGSYAAMKSKGRSLQSQMKAAGLAVQV